MEIIILGLLFGSVYVPLLIVARYGKNGKA